MGSMPSSEVSKYVCIAVITRFYTYNNIMPLLEKLVVWFQCCGKKQGWSLEPLSNLAIF